ncbi:hypothetical protein Henu3_gp58 [Mycobacterium phage Henu3]|uniref:Uncharacterized protein n=1 Tax=Mycobacterium phage Henu3 TaxID=2492961 RepID=A0A410T7X0_9CAUD|nr:hypothetical protein I5G68_gp54 [Mycobacterium phage Henu3]QAU05000.1 hypothetical protein Henu3_gp58 [Mycobacterium phage Henu3]
MAHVHMLGEPAPAGPQPVGPAQPPQARHGAALHAGGHVVEPLVERIAVALVEALIPAAHTAPRRRADTCRCDVPRRYVIGQAHRSPASSAGTSGSFSPCRSPHHCTTCRRYAIAMRYRDSARLARSSAFAVRSSAFASRSSTRSSRSAKLSVNAFQSAVSAPRSAARPPARCARIAVTTTPTKLHRATITSVLMPSCLSARRGSSACSSTPASRRQARAPRR